MISNIKEKLGQLKLQDWFFIIFSICWVGIIMLDYFNKQVIYGPSFKYFRYYGLFSFLTVIGIAYSLYINRISVFSRFTKPFLNGTIILAAVIGIVWSITIAFNAYWNAPLDYTNYLHMAGKAIYTLGCTFFLVVACYGAGSTIREKLVLGDKSLTFVLLDIALGFVIYTFFMMILGAFGLLNLPLLIGGMVIMALSNYKESWWFVKKSLWSGFSWPKDLNFWGGLLMFFILVFLTMNYLYSQAPFPLGFDARNFYVNISNLIADAGALIPGFQPYAWGLVMSTGYIAFDSPEITLFISTLGGILTLLGIYEFSHRHLGISSNLSLLGVMLFLVSPTVTNHWMIEFKIDLALLFIQMVILNLFMWWSYEKKNAASSDVNLIQDKADIKIIGILGVLFGYGLAVKALSVFLIIGIFVAIWFYHKDIVGVLSMTALSIGAVLLVQLDANSGLRDYHLSPEITGGVLAGIGLLGMGWSFVKTRTSFLSSVKTISLMGILMVLTFSPWMYKNYTFTKSTSLMKLVLGEKPSPSINAPELIKNYRQQQKEGNK